MQIILVFTLYQAIQISFRQLSVAGGINEYGSFREINLLRNNEIIEVLDVYDLLIDGKYNLKQRLKIWRCDFY